MNLADARVVLRPRTQGEILDLAALWCFTADRWLYARLAGAVLLPSLLACGAARWLGAWSWGEVWLLAIGLATVTQGVFTVATSRALFEHDVSAGPVLQHFVRRLPAYLGALVVTRVLLALGAVTLALLPGAWSRIAFVHEACLLEGGGPSAAAKRAWRMTRHRTSDVMVLLFGMGMALLAATFTAEILGHGLLEFVLQLGRPFGSWFDDGGSLYALVGFHAAIPYLAVTRFLGYLDQRTRGDGWDVQLRFMALANEGESPRRRAS